MTFMLHSKKQFNRPCVTAAVTGITESIRFYSKNRNLEFNKKYCFVDQHQNKYIITKSCTVYNIINPQIMQVKYFIRII